MKSSIVLGLGFGDEGKGLVTDYLVSKANNPWVVRFSGGHQVGHTVVVGKKRHVFSNFGSGTLRGAPTYWSEFCTVDPVGLVREHALLLSKGTSPKLYINRKCPIVTPYDKIANHREESARSLKHGSVGVGFGSTLQRESDHYSLHYEDLFFRAVLLERLEYIRRYYELGTIDTEEFLDCCDKATLRSYAQPFFRVDNFVDSIFEGSQGLLLDQDYGFFPHVTRSNTGTKNALKLNPGGFDEIFLVTRAYQTRHGNGPMFLGENPDLPIKEDSFETNVENRWQGPFRKGILNGDMLSYALMKDDYLNINRIGCTLVVTCMDHLKDYRCILYNRVETFLHYEDFVRALGDRLGVQRLMVSFSPDSSQLQRL